MTHRTNKRIATRSALGRKQRGVAPVSYTHLTLPTSV